MCDEITKIFPLSSKVVAALCAVDREKFIPAGFAPYLAYDINPLPMTESQYISSPLTVAQMTEYLAPNGGDSVLEIGCGSGYQAMVLSHLFRRVFSIERIDKLLIKAKERFKLLQSHNIFVKLDDGQKGWAEYAPFDAILFSACARNIPQVIINQLQEGGVIVAPMLEGNKQVIKRFRKCNGILGAGECLGDCLFVDVQDDIVR
ncbi:MULTISPECIES: protein-L-isoaspartate(D-aspartate) O-methyltransferase [Helicobacter]|nr:MULTISPECIES: protein-L-isoaspartate(D-aspartate) O-methyltransferase [Helicobacter]